MTNLWILPVGDTDRPWELGLPSLTRAHSYITFLERDPQLPYSASMSPIHRELPLLRVTLE